MNSGAETLFAETQLKVTLSVGLEVSHILIKGHYNPLRLDLMRFYLLIVEGI